MKNKLAIVVGHSKEFPGTMGVDPVNRFEYWWNLDLAELIYRLAKDIGLDCAVFTMSGKNVEACYDLVGKWAFGHNSVAIELHFNSASKKEQGKARGTETLFDDDPEESMEFARMIQEAVCAVFNREFSSNRGIKKREPGKNGEPDDRGYRNLKACKITACLVEPFFGDSPKECLLAMERRYEYARALVLATLKFFREKEQEKKTVGAYH